ncbi:class II myosin [Coemansia sp. RSA 989]|nr:class II myosin [Coemansia sp. RSA 1086]KAJ1748747.1 class II myosin [Coemansia sp. RSA 1821]KAJ1865020.1 class II myosin [Coemansia sp. RSA 989]KAJ2633033.1 class II myosin [Coemansia sp. RSA 1290]KAJ2650189.1 class II myosin [Coemansia sp. RSA 1250]KAJ2669411.1 class II myosin [Coemansia sp. RSA 1085]
MLRSNRQGPTVASIRKAIQQGLDRPESPAPSGSLSSRTAHATPDLFEQANVNFTEKKWVWVPHEKEGFIAGYVVSEDGDDMVTVHLMTGREVPVNINHTEKVNPPKFEKVEDMADLGYLNEASVVHNLKQRYASNMIYTYSGLFLVAVNPYYNLQIYGPDFVAAYKNKKRTEVPPHIFSIADAAFHDMLHSKENQSILITGESGAGKTENTKKVIQYLTAIAGDHKTATGLTSTGRSLEQQILCANPILESFGNAQTIRNNNSSRFGKFIRIEFNFAGQIAGANIEWYLFEKPRVTSQSKHERNYHVFYQFMKGADKSIKDRLLIDKGPEGYTFTRKCRQTIEGVDDSIDFEALVSAMDTTGFKPEEQLDLFRIIAAILHMGNMQFQATRNDEAVLREQVAAEKVCHVLGIQLSDFTRALLRPSIKAGRDWVTQSRTLQQVVLSVEALARSMYERMFGELVSRINAAMNRPDGKSTFIGVLDIAGFEILETNSFEQLCINYTNERLQQFFNRTMFVLEQEEYTREGIEWNFIDFGMDLQPTIDLIDRTKPIGIMSCLDEECVMPKATDKTFTEKLHGLWANKSDKYEAPRFAMGFTIKHYASQVEYSTEGWLEKNKDPLNENVTRLLGNSSEPFVAQLYADYADGGSGSTGDVASAAGAGSGGARGRVPTTLKRGAFRTVGQRHKDQLNLLMAQLNSTQPHFVRCILPNAEKRAGKIDTPLVLDQLRCNGVLEGIRITRQGFPNRIPFPEFRQRYEILAPNTIPRQVFVDSKQAASLLLDAFKMDKAKYRLGHTKVFFRAGVLAELEEIRDMELSKIIVQFQAVARGALSRSRFRRRIEQAKAIRVIQRNARVYNQLCAWPWWKLYRTVKPLLHVTRVDEEMRKKETRIGELEQLARGEAEERQRLEAEHHNLEREKKSIEALLDAERRAALDQEEILKRTQEREVALEEDLREHAARLEELEEQCNKLTLSREELAAQLAALSQQREAEAVSMRDLTSQHQEKDQAIATAEAQAAEYRQALEDLEQEYARTVERAGSSEAALAAIRESESQLRADLAQREAELDAQVHELAELKELAEKTAKELVRAQELANTAASARETAETQGSQAQAQLAEALQKQQALEGDVSALSIKLDTAEQTLGNVQQEKQRLADANSRMTQEIDELRCLIDEKADQGTRESELRRMRESELTKLRDELGEVAGELEEFRAAHIESEQMLRSEIEQLRRERDAAVKEHEATEQNRKGLEEQLNEHVAHMEELEETNMRLESQLTDATTRTREIESEFSSTKEYHDAATQERDELRAQLAKAEEQRAALDMQLAQAQKTAEQAQAEHSSSQKELADAQKTIGELQARLEENENLRDSIQQRITLQAQEYEELKEKYSQDAVARVRQLEEANQEAFAELDDVRSGYNELEARCANLEKARARLEAEAEDLRLATEREQSHSLALEQANEEFKSQHDVLAAELKAAQETAQQLREELEAQRSAAEALKTTHSETDRQLRSLVSEVGTDACNMRALQTAREELEAQVADLAAKLEAESAALATAQEVKARLETQHREMQDRLHGELEAKDSQAEEARQKLLQEVQELGERLERATADSERAQREKEQAQSELQRAQQAASSSTRGRDEAEDARRELGTRLQAAEAETEALRKAVEDYHVQADRHEKRANTLQDTLQARELELAQSARKLQRSERRLEEVMAQAAYHLDARNRLDSENVELREKLDEAYRQLGRADLAPRSIGSAPANGTLRKLEAQAEERVRALEDARQALAASLQAAQREAEEKQNELVDLDRSYGALQDELAAAHASLLSAERERDDARDALAQLKEQLSSERALRGNNEELSNSLSERVEAMRDALASADASARDAAEQRAHAERIAAAARAEVSEAQAARDEAISARDAAEDSVRKLEAQALDLQSKLDDALLASAQLEHVRDGLQHELDAIGSRHRGDYDAHGRVLDELREKYQTELEQTTAELETVKRDHVALREAYISLDSTLALRSQELDRANEEATDAKKELTRVMSKLEELAPAYEAARDAAKAREAELESARHERDSAVARAAAATALHDDLRDARDRLEARLDEVQAKYIEASKGRQTAEKAALQLEDDLRSARARLSDIDHDQTSADERVARLDAVVADAHLALDKEREANTILTKDKNDLEKQLKDLRLRIVKLETDAVASQVKGSPSLRPVPTADLSARIETQAKAALEHQHKAKQLERQVRELQFQLAERDKAKQRSEIDSQRLTSRIKRLEAHVKDLEASEQRLATANHRLERELGSLRSRTASPAFS